MVLRVDFRGIGKTVKIYNGIIKRMKSEPTKMTEEMSILFKRAVSKRLTNDSGQNAGHNTPTKLRKRLKRQVFTGGHKVFFIGIGDKYEQALPEIVESGAAAAPDTSSRGPFDRGSKPKRFWEHAMKEFNASDKDRLMKKYERRIVVGRK